MKKEIKIGLIIFAVAIILGAFLLFAGINMSTTQIWVLGVVLVFLLAAAVWELLLAYTDFFKNHSSVIGLFFAFLLAMGLRSFAFEPYNIPSGSMFPTLLVGDHLFISKYAYGYSRHSFPYSLPLIPKGRIFEKVPKVGDVVVFRVTPELMPSIERSVDYIKRVVALPGDTVQMKNGRLYLNSQEVERKYLSSVKAEIEGKDVLYSKYLETLPNGVTHEIYEINDMMQSDDTPLIKVPEGHFFAMGDNRDNSYDSRFFGVVPLTHLEGRAEVIFYSNNGTGALWQIWKWPTFFVKWPEFIRKERLFTKIQ